MKQLRLATTALIIATLALGCNSNSSGNGAPSTTPSSSGTNNTTTTTPNTTTTNEPPTAATTPPFGTFLVLHMEAGNAPAVSTGYSNGGSTTASTYQAYFWPHLVDIVSYADTKGAKLTLLFQVQWFEYISADTTRTTTVLDWVNNGHEIGLHHHGYDHLDWDGFSDRTSGAVVRDSRYRGTMLDLLAIVQSFANMTTATISDRGYDLDAMDHVFVYDAAGSGGDTTVAMRPPYQVIKPGIDVIQAGMAYQAYKATAPNQQARHLAQMKDLFNQAQDDDLIGFVTHAWDIALDAQAYGGNLADSDFGKWLQHVEDVGHRVRTVNDLLTSYQQTYPIAQASASQILGRW